MRVNVRMSVWGACWIVAALIGAAGRPASAGEVAPSVAAKACPNAAVIYWQAFALMPKLTEPELKQFNDAAAGSAAVSQEVQSLVTQYGAALDELDRAVKQPACDWSLDYSRGMAMPLPHVAKARELSKAALLWARLRFAANETDAALSAVAATMKLARDIGRSPVLVSLLVDASIEASANELLASHLPELSGEELDVLAKRIAELPTTATVAECIAMEGDSFAESFGQQILKAEAAQSQGTTSGRKLLIALYGDDEGPFPNDKAAQAAFDSFSVADWKAAIAKLRTDYQEMARIAALGHRERREQSKRLVAEIDEAKAVKIPADRDRLWSAAIIPAIPGVIERDTQREIRRDLLDMAIQVQRHGQDALKSSPHLGAGSIEFRETGAGFELRYHYAPTDKWEVLRVGSASE